jgi:DNA-binding response OmpR family regulator
VSSADGVSVLVVEDNADLRNLFRVALRIAGFNVREAADGYHALVSIEESPPSVVVLDLGLPRVSGFNVLDEIRERRDLPQPAVVVVTGMEDVADLDAPILRKPVEPSELVSAVRRAVRRSSATSGT